MAPPRPPRFLAGDFAGPCYAPSGRGGGRSAPPSEDAARFGATLRQARKQAGLTQQELANRAEIDRATVSLIENGREEPRADTVRRLATVLAINPADLWRGTDSDVSTPSPHTPPSSHYDRPRTVNETVDLHYEPIEAAAEPHPGLQALLADERTRLMLGITNDEEAMLRSIRTRAEQPLSKDFFIEVLISFRRHRQGS